MNKFKDALTEKEQSELSDGLKKDVIKMLKKIIASDDKLKKEAEALDKKYKKETGKSFFFNYVYNDKPFSKEDIKYVEAK